MSILLFKTRSPYQAHRLLLRRPNSLIATSYSHNERSSISTLDNAHANEVSEEGRKYEYLNSANGTLLIAVYLFLGPVTISSVTVANISSLVD